MKYDLINTGYSFSMYENLFSVQAPIKNIDINQLIEIIKFGYLKDEISLIRTSNSKDEYSRLKNTTLPCITTSGEFIYRNSKGIVRHSGLIQIDIDDVHNYDTLFKAICEDTYTYLCFRSPRGKGIKIVFKIKPNIDTHLSQFYALQNYFKDKYKIEIDKACKDISRAMLLSYDPDIFCNPYSDVYEELFLPVSITEKNDKGKEIKRIYIKNAQNTQDLVAQIVDEVLRSNIDITTPYENWIKVGYALVDALGETGRESFHQISQINPDYQKRGCDRQYNHLLKHSNGSISIATLIYLVKKSGLDIKHEH